MLPYCAGRLLLGTAFAIPECSRLYRSVIRIGSQNAPLDT